MCLEINYEERECRIRNERPRSTSRLGAVSDHAEAGGHRLVLADPVIVRG